MSLSVHGSSLEIYPYLINIGIYNLLLHSCVPLFRVSSERAGQKSCSQPRIVVLRVASGAAGAQVVDGEEEVYGADNLLEFWQSILSVLRPNLPVLQEVRAFTSNRLEGFGVPTGEACFIFATSDCFERILTEEGKALEKAIGHCDESEWTVVSV